MDYNPKNTMGIHGSMQMSAGWTRGWAEGGALLPRGIPTDGRGGLLATHHFINRSKELSAQTIHRP